MHDIPTGQFLIGDATCAVRAAQTYHLDDTVVFTGRGTRVSEVRDRNGTLVGFVIGNVIDLGRAAFSPAVIQLPDKDMAVDDERAVRGWLASLSGAFLVVLKTAGRCRVYPSAASSCVFDVETGRVGATAGALFGPREFDRRFDRELFETAGIGEGKWLPGGLTCHHGVTRLLPNHMLDLSTLKPARFWQGGMRRTDVPDDVLSRVGDIVRTTIGAAAGDFSLALALSAGRDSRMVLALARPFRDRLSTFTIAHDAAGLDVVTAREISSSLGLAHRTIRPREATGDERAAWMHNNGCVVGGINQRMHPTLHCFGPHEGVLAGSFCEVGRGYYWSKQDKADTGLDARSLRLRMDLPDLPRITRALDRWLGSVGVDDVRHVLDLAYIEHRLGGWASPQSFADPEICCHPGPLENHEIFDCFLSLPVEWRAVNHWVDRIIALNWPELGSWPYNRYRSNWRNVLDFGSKVLSRDRVRRYIRRRLGEVQGR